MSSTSCNASDTTAAVDGSGIVGMLDTLMAVCRISLVIVAFAGVDVILSLSAEEGTSDDG